MDKPTHLVVLVHGMNTRAHWMTEVRDLLEEEGFAAVSTSYGYFSPFKFLSPFRIFRQTAIDRILSDIRTARALFVKKVGSEPQKMSIISHSFGTYVVARILEEAEDLKWNRVIFCGSVVREDFSFVKVIDRFDEPLLNEIGTKDYWPALAESCGWGYGSVGTTGFNRPGVHTRWHDGLAHSDFLTADFCKAYWVDFLRDGKLRRAKGDPKGMPLGVRLLAALPLRYIPILLAIAACLFLPYLAVALRTPTFQIVEGVAPIQIQNLLNLDLGQPYSKPKPVSSLDELGGLWVAILDQDANQSLYVTSDRDAIFSEFGPAKFFSPAWIPFRSRESIGIQTPKMTCYYSALMESATTRRMDFGRGSPLCPERIFLVRPSTGSDANTGKTGGLPPVSHLDNVRGGEVPKSLPDQDIRQLAGNWRAQDTDQRIKISWAPAGWNVEIDTLGMGRISETDYSGANIVVTLPGVACYYSISFLNRNTVIGSFRSGNAVCPSSGRLLRQPD